MAIKFFNVKTGESNKLDNPHLIAAYINSSDLHVNSGQGQDFGWRLSPEDVARIDKLKADPSKLEEIGRFLGKPAGDVRQVDFVKYVSHLDDMEARVKTSQADEKPAFQDEYEAAVAAAKSGKEADSKPASTEKTESPKTDKK